MVFSENVGRELNCPLNKLKVVLGKLENMGFYGQVVILNEELGGGSGDFMVDEIKVGEESAMQSSSSMLAWARW